MQYIFINMRLFYVLHNLRILYLCILYNSVFNCGSGPFFVFVPVCLISLYRVVVS